MKDYCILGVYHENIIIQDRVDSEQLKVKVDLAKKLIICIFSDIGTLIKNWSLNIKVIIIFKITSARVR